MNARFAIVTVGAFIVGIGVGAQFAKSDIGENASDEMPIDSAGSAEVQAVSSAPPLAAAGAPATASNTARPRTASTLSRAQRDSLSARRDALEKRFEFNADEIRGGGWYQHADQSAENSWNRSYLDAVVNHRGVVYLRSHYYGDDWIFHDHVVARVGQRVIETEPVTPERHNSTSVWETASYTGSRDNGLLTAIASADSTVRVLVRLQGDRGNKEFGLSHRDRTAITETVELARILRLIGRRPLTPTELAMAESTLYYADPGLGYYYLPACENAQLIPFSRRLEFRGEQAAQAAGFARSPTRGC